MMKHSIQVVILILSIQSTVVAQPEEVEFVIPLEERWNMISAPVNPEDNDMEVIFSEIVERDNLILVKDGQGRFYRPAYDFNGIPFWDFHNGYQVKLAEADTLIITGEAVDPETPIQLLEGWNLIAYFPEQGMDAHDAFANIENQLIIAKDVWGAFFRYDDFGFPWLWMERGQGYQVKVSEDVELIWPQE